MDDSKRSNENIDIDPENSRETRSECENTENEAVIITETEKEKNEDDAAEEKNKRKEKHDKKTDVKQLVKENENLTKNYNEINDRYLRVLAEYDNFRKRTAKERDGIYSDAYGDVLKEILPIIDSLERAALYTDGDKVLEGVKLTLAQFQETLKRLGIEEIQANGENVKFDPVYHNAVMHVEDENYGENEIAEVFQKGYKKGDKIIRHSMVKVAN